MKSKGLISVFRDEKGVALMLAAVTMAVLSVVAAGVVILAFKERQIDVLNEEGMKAFYIAEAGIQRARYMLMSLDDTIDVNGDDKIDSRDFPGDESGIDTGQVNFGDGSYRLTFGAEFASYVNLTFYLSGTPHDEYVVDFTLKEDGVPIGSTTLERHTGDPQHVEITFTDIEADPSNHNYAVDMAYVPISGSGNPVFLRVNKGVGHRIHTFNTAGHSETVTDLSIDQYISDAQNKQGMSVDEFDVTCTGRVGNTARSIRFTVSHDTFLKYARFVETGNLGYGAGAHLYSEVYAGGNIDLDGYPVTFDGLASAGGTINNKSNGIFNSGYIENATQITLDSNVDLDHYRALADSAGLHIDNTNPDPTINLSLFDFVTNPSQPTYNGNPYYTDPDGKNYTIPSNFNGTIFVEGDARVSGHLEGESVTIYASDDMFITGETIMGTNNDSTPTKMGLVAWDYVYIDEYTPRVLRIEAALMAVKNNWRPNDYNDSYDKSPRTHTVPTGSYDLDRNGSIEALNADGWNEEDLLSDVNNLTTNNFGTGIYKKIWFLAIKGPIITKNGGSAGAWTSAGSYSSGRPTRKYLGDPDIAFYPPPNFPVILNRWNITGWREVETPAGH